MPVLPAAAAMKKDGDRLLLTYRPEDIPTSALLEQLQQAGPIRELTVQPQNIDHLIADMYREMNL